MKKLTNDMKKLFKTLPEEHKETVLKLINISFYEGVERTQTLMSEVTNILPPFISDFELLLKQK